MSAVEVEVQFVEAIQMVTANGTTCLEIMVKNVYHGTKKARIKTQRPLI